jgi:DNA-binding transcriptional ArsR family regulator
MEPGFRSLLWYLLAGTRGGSNRQRILEQLRISPCNAHQLAQRLRLDYRTARHHLSLLERSGVLVRPVGKAYASPYELSPLVAAEFETLLEIVGAAGPHGHVAAGRSRARPGVTTA